MELPLRFNILLAHLIRSLIGLVLSINNIEKEAKRWRRYQWDEAKNYALGFMNWIDFVQFSFLFYWLFGKKTHTLVRIWQVSSSCYHQTRYNGPMLREICKFLQFLSKLTKNKYAFVYFRKNVSYIKAS